MELRDEDKARVSDSSGTPQLRRVERGTRSIADSAAPTSRGNARRISSIAKMPNGHTANMIATLS